MLRLLAAFALLGALLGPASASASASAPEGAPQATPLYHGLRALGPVASRAASLDFHSARHRTSLSYNVDHAPLDFKFLADDARVVGLLRCSEGVDSLVAHTASASAAAELAGELSSSPKAVTGFCAGPSRDRATVPVVGTVLDAQVDGASLHLALEPLSLTDVVRHGNATFTAELHDGASSVAPETSCPSSCISCINGGGGADCEQQCSACSDTCTTCVKFAGGLACAERCSGNTKATCTLGDLIEGHCTANADWSHSWDGWTLLNEDDTTIYQHGFFNADAKVVCEQCHAHLTPTAVVNIQVKDNKLQALTVQVTGDYTAIANVSATVEDSFSTSGTKSLASPSLPSINFFLGAFPVHISFDVEVSADYSLTATGQAEVYSGLTVSGSVKGGADWQSGSEVTPVWDANFQPSYIKPSGSLQAHATVVVSPLPSLTVKIDEIGSATIAVKPTATLDASLSDKCVKATLSGALGADLSATIGLQLAGHTLGPSKTFGPKPVLSKNWPSLWSGEFGC